MNLHSDDASESNFKAISGRRRIMCDDKSFRDLFPETRKKFVKSEMSRVCSSPSTNASYFAPNSCIDEKANSTSILYLISDPYLTGLTKAR